MTNQIDHIVEHLFNKKNLADVSENELTDFVSSYPYFAAGHFLLAKKMQVVQPEQSSDQVAIASLYYHNSLWFQWLLDLDVNQHHDAAHPSPAGDASPEIPDHDDLKSNIAVEEIEIQENGAAKHAVIEAVNNQEAIKEHEAISDQQPTDPFTMDTENIIDPIDFTPKEIAEVDHVKKSEPNDIVIPETAEQTIQPVAETELISNPENNIIENAAGESKIIVEANEPLSFKFGDDIANNTAAEENTRDQPGADHENSTENDEHNLKDEEEGNATAASIGKTLASAALIPTKAEIEKNDLVFEPYHTIDYFASQGIKLQQSDLSKDKFGKQLKSFTEWLRSMKRLPEAPVETNLDEATQRSIQKVAEHSIEEKEIVTETMAEVWIKQGNKEKAIDTLRKLSLLNPSKSHYFAAKIEQLKG